MGEVVAIVKDAASEIGKLYQRGARDWLECGRLLQIEKESRASDEWLPWIEANRAKLTFGKSAAYRLIQAWELFQSTGKVFDDLWWNESKVRGTQGTGENEWYTPSKYIEMARKVLGGIDLDPASNAAAQEIVQAKVYFPKEQNGLAQVWHGRVWMNPPYSQPLVGQCITKLVEEVERGNVTAAISLTHNYTDTSWFHEASEIVSATCFTRGRVKFLDPNGNECAPTQGQAFHYYGDDVATFADVFKDIGLVVVPYGEEVR